MGCNKLLIWKIACFNENTRWFLVDIIIVAYLRVAGDQWLWLPLTVSCFSHIEIGSTFLVPAHPGSPGKRAVKRVCVWYGCVCVGKRCGWSSSSLLVECKRCWLLKKGKVFPYSLPIVGPGTDPGVQAVSPLVTWSESRHRPGIRLTLLSARPAVTSVAFTRWCYL